jgi:hypothetical protein
MGEHFRKKVIIQRIMVATVGQGALLVVAGHLLITVLPAAEQLYRAILVALQMGHRTVEEEEEVLPLLVEPLLPTKEGLVLLEPQV